MGTAIFIQSNKGGVGKSTICRTLRSYLRRLRIRSASGAVKVAAFDCDTANKSFSESCGLKGAHGEYLAEHNEKDPFNGVGRINLRDFDESRKVLNMLRLEADFLLFDLPADAAHNLERIFGSLGELTAFFNKHNFRVIVISVINSEPVCAVNVVNTIRSWGEAWHWVAKIVYPNYCSRFTAFNDGTFGAPNAAREVARAGGKVFNFELMSPSTYFELAELNSDFQECLSHPCISGESKAELGKFIKKSFLQFKALFVKPD